MQNPFEVVIQNQSDDEDIIKMWRHHPFTLIKPAFRVIAFVMIPLALVLITHLAMFTNPILFVLFLLILVIVLTYAAYEWVSWFNDIYILTNYRIIDVQQEGFFNRKFTEASLDKVQDVSFHIKGVFATFLNFGDIEVSTAGPQDNILMTAVRKPDHQAAFVLRRQQEFIAEHSDNMSAEQLITLLAKHGDKLEKLSDLEREEKLQNIEEQLEKTKQAKRRRKTKQAKKDAKEET